MKQLNFLSTIAVTKPRRLFVCMLVSGASAAFAMGNQSEDQHHKAGGSITTTLELPHGTPEEVGMSGERLNKVKDVVQEFIDEGRIQGAVVCVARRGKVVYFEAQGVSNQKNPAPMPADAMFHMASSTKPILGVAAMMMIEEGLFKPSDPVEKYIPEFKNIKVAVLKDPVGEGSSDAKSKDNSVSKSKFMSKKTPNYRLVDPHRPITIHDLLTHTSGIAGGKGLGEAKKKRQKQSNDTLATRIARVAEGPLDFQPGTRWGYGGGLDVVARVIEIVSGMPFNEFVQERIFDPLDMKDTHWIVPKDKLDRMLFVVKGKAGWPTTYFSGSAGLISTARDYLHFEQMLLNKGELFGNRILKPESVEMMSSSQVGDLYADSAKGGAGLAFGYTVAITVDPSLTKTGRSTGAFGWGGAAGTVSWTDPKQELVGVIMVQQPTADLPVRIAEAIGAAIDDWR